MLSDSQVKSLKIEDGKRHADRDGLVLELRPSKKKLNKVFIFRFQWNKKPQTIMLGNYPSTSSSLIVLWHLKESQRFFSELALPPELVAAAKLDSWLISYCLQHSVGQVSSRIVQQCGPNSLRKKDVMDAALSELKELNRVHRENTGQGRFKWLHFTRLLFVVLVSGSGGYVESIK